MASIAKSDDKDVAANPEGHSRNVEMVRLKRGCAFQSKQPSTGIEPATLRTLPS